MTNSPTPSPQPGPVRRRWRSLLLNRYSAAVGLALLAGLAGGAWWAWVFVHEELAPLVEQNLSESLKRPVNLGRVERFSLTGLRFGPSTIPATPTDPDNLTLQAVEVGYNPLRLLLTRQLNLAITAVRPSLYLEQDKAGQWIKPVTITEEEQGPVQTEIEWVRLQDAEVRLAPYPAKGQKPTTITLTQVNGAAQIQGQAKQQVINLDLGLQFAQGGTVRISGVSRPGLQENILNVQGENLPAREIGLLASLPLNLKAGRITRADLVAELVGKAAPRLAGTADLQAITAEIPGLPKPFTRATGRLRFQGQKVMIENLTALYGGRASLLVSGDLELNKDFNLRAQVRPASIPTLLNVLNVKSPLPITGQVRADLRVRGPLNKPILSGLVVNTQAVQLDRVSLSRVQAQFELVDSILKLPAIQANPTAGGQVTGRGQVNTANGQFRVNFQATGVPGDAIARAYGAAPPITIGPVAATAQLAGSANQVLITAQWQAPNATYPGSGQITTDGTTTLLRNTVFQVAGGTVRANGRILNNQFQATLEASQLQLNRLSSDLRGLANGQVAVTANLAAFSPATVRATGQLRFPQGLAIANTPITRQLLTADFRWDGQKLQLNRASAPGLTVNGLIYARLQGTPAITGLDLNVVASNYDLRQLPVKLPNGVRVAGRANFNGQITGTPTALNVNGRRLVLNNFAINTVAFEPVLAGTVTVRAGQGVNLQVAGVRGDRIALRLDRNYQPLAFDVRRDQAIATGRAQGDLLRVRVQNFPLAALNIVPNAELGAVRGELTDATLNVNLRRNTVAGTVALANFGLGSIRGNRFRGEINYANGVLTLSDGELQQGRGRYVLNGTVTQGSDPSFTGQLKVVQGNLQDVTEALQWFDLADLLRGIQPPTYGSAADVQPVPVGDPSTSLLTQLQRISEIRTLLSQQVSQREALLVPSLAELEGSFTGVVLVTGSLRAGITSQFNLKGQNWKWGRFTAAQVTLRGSFDQNVLTLQPLRFQTGESLVAFTGQLGGTSQSGQLRVANLPIDALQDFVSLPLNLSGKLNATATLAGNLADPQAVGELSLVDGTLNGTPVQSAQGGFNYRNARFRFGTTVVVRGPEPVQITGNIPYQLPFSEVAPDSDQLELNLNVKNEGLALLNLFTQQVSWVNGNGQVNLQVRGTLSQPQATGIISIDNATLKAQALPEPLTGVTGTARFERDRILVEGIRGQFSQGQVLAQGVLPIFAPLSADAAAQTSPLTVTLDRLALNLRGLYRGGVNGQVTITNTALAPQIGGTIELANGQVLLPDQPPGATTASNPSDQDNGPFEPPQLRNLRLTLGDRIQITRQPILNFLASGELLINGPLDDLRPDGTIRLRAGQVNLYTTVLNLAGGYEHTARFTPSQGLDPTLDVRLITSVPEVTRARVRAPSSTFASSDVEEVSATSLGALQTVRIQARASGPASQLFDNLQLTSSPARSETEIIALLGGGFVNTLGRGDSTLALANLAGSALLTQIQTVIGNALGLTEFRLFPTVTTAARENRSATGASTLGLAAEVGVDITTNISASILKVLTSDERAQFGLRYRVNDQVLIRGSSDFSGDTRAVVEYEARF